VDCPKKFGLVAEPCIGVESGCEVGQKSNPEVLSEEPVSFQELSKFGEDGENDILPGELVDGESEYF
jgi:hypothetical protein